MKKLIAISITILLLIGTTVELFAIETKNNPQEGGGQSIYDNPHIMRIDVKGPSAESLAANMRRLFDELESKGILWIGFPWTRVPSFSCQPDGSCTAFTLFVAKSSDDLQSIPVILARNNIEIINQISADSIKAIFGVWVERNSESAVTCKATTAKSFSTWTQAYQYYNGMTDSLMALNKDTIRSWVKDHFNCEFSDDVQRYAFYLDLATRDDCDSFSNSGSCFLAKGFLSQRYYP